MRKLLIELYANVCQSNTEYDNYVTELQYYSDTEIESEFYSVGFTESDLKHYEIIRFNND